MQKVKTIVLKEWAEVFKNRLVLFTVVLLPLIITALPIGILLVTRALPAGDLEAEMQDLPTEAIDMLCAGLNGADCLDLYMLNLFALMFMILPAAIPVTIASYSIVGEKTARSLEPLLATPITTLELLAGKALAAIVPAVLATWAAFAIYLTSAWFITSEAVFGRITDPLWFVAIFVVAPLLTLMGVSFAIMISSRVTDPRVAEQLSFLVILPIMVGVIGQSVGLLLIDLRFVLIFALAVFLVDALLVYLAINLFQRETILTRWK
jgi:ABC-2 type transport system permease protein